MRMNVNIKIWLVIAVIFVIGIGTTSVTKRFVREQEISVLENSSESGMTGEERNAIAERFMVTEQEKNPVSADASTTFQNGGETSLMIPPVATASQKQGTDSDDAAEDRYIQYLEELDIQVAKRYADSKDTTVNTLKVNAEYEQRLWESELETIIKTLSGKLEEEAYEAFLAEQKVWLRERESKAMIAARRHSGSTLESVEYATSLAAQTRSRVYALVLDYRLQMEEH